MKLLVAGSRTIKDPVLVVKAIIDSGFVKESKPEMVSGGAKGVDTLIEKVAKEIGLTFTKFEAKWSDLSHPNAIIKENKYGKYDALAGHRRNKRMAEYADAGVIIMKKGGTSGSLDMIEQLKKLNKPVYVKEV